MTTAQSSKPFIHPLPNAEWHNELFLTLSCQGRTFTVSYAQLNVEAPSRLAEFVVKYGMVSSVFAGERPVVPVIPLHRDPRLVELIVNHLGGYEVFPLCFEGGYWTSEPSVVLRNLLKEAKWLGLKEFEKKVRAEMTREGVEEVEGQNVPTGVA